MTSSTVEERRLLTIAFPSADEFAEMVAALRKPGDKLEGLALGFKNIAGGIENAQWEARFAEPPTYADLGAFAVFMDDLDLELGWLQDTLRDFRGSWGEIVNQAREGHVRFETKPDEDA